MRLIVPLLLLCLLCVTNATRERIGKESATSSGKVQSEQHKMNNNIGGRSVTNKETKTSEREQMADKAVRSVTVNKAASRVKNGNTNKKVNKWRGFMLPRLLPHMDKEYLLAFGSDNCDHCDQMEPVLKRLEEDLGTNIRRINIFSRKDTFSLLESIGYDECGTLPFYYNRRTGQAICGATSYLNLKRWGTGNLQHLFQDPPENLYEMDNEAHVKKGDVGLKGFFTDKIKNLEKKEKPAKKTGNKSTDSIKEKSSSSAAERTKERRAKREKKSLANAKL